MNGHLKNLADQLINVSGLIALALLWELLPRFDVVDRQFIPPLSQVLAFLGKMAANGTLFLHITASLQRIFLGLALAITVAVPVGFLLGGFFPGLSRHLNPLFRLFEQVNVLALYLIFILFFGIGETVKVIIIFWTTVWPILFTTIAGIQNINSLYIKIARSFGASKLTVFTKVILPGAAPIIFTGIRTGSNNAFFILVIAEAMGAHFGLGRLIQRSAFGSVIVIALLGMMMNYLFHYVEENLLAWNQNLKSLDSKSNIQ